MSNESQGTGVTEATRRVMAISSLILVGSVVVAALLPAAPDGFIRGPAGTLAAVLAGLALVTVWGAAIWHAATIQTWNATVPRWAMIVILVFGTGVAGILYYLFYARSYHPANRAAG